MEKVEDVKRPLKVGEVFLVPCIVRGEKHTGKRILYITPVFNLPHNDVASGQREIHYHTDYRFVRVKMKVRGPARDRYKFSFPKVVRRHSEHLFVETIRPTLEHVENFLVYYELPVINEGFVGITPPETINKEAIKHKCLVRGKCPHRGFDMSQVEGNQQGIKTCPMHGLRFNKEGRMLRE